MSLEILITNNSLKGKLIEVCLRSYINDNLYEIVDTKKIKYELRNLINQNIVCSYSDVNVDNYDSMLKIDVFADNVVVNCTVLPTGKLEIL